MTYHLVIGDRRLGLCDAWTTSDWDDLRNSSRMTERFIFFFNMDVHYRDYQKNNIDRRQVYVEFPTEADAALFKLTHL